MRSIDEIKADYNDCQNCKTNHDCLSILSNCPKLYNIAHYEHEILRAITDGIPLDALETMCAAWRDGRVMVAPTKPYEKAYVPRPLSDEIMEVEIQRYEMCENGCCGVVKAAGEWRFEISAIKTTHEAAEAALKGDTK